ncbi:MAG: exodeoxyribonuclease VII small subunit [Paracoccaceae bacterium]|jgi:exodeoxyribonuclease VII small subunit
MTKAHPAKVEDLTYEQALAALEEVVTRLERGDVPLDESIGLYERGAALKARCEAMLREAELKVAQITRGPDGEVATAPLPGA